MILRNLSNDDANAEDDAQSKMNLYFTSEIRRCLDLFDWNAHVSKNKNDSDRDSV